MLKKGRLPSQAGTGGYSIEAAQGEPLLSEESSGIERKNPSHDTQRETNLVDERPSEPRCAPAEALAVAQWALFFAWPWQYAFGAFQCHSWTTRRFPPAQEAFVSPPVARAWDCPDPPESLPVSLGHQRPCCPFAETSRWIRAQTEPGKVPPRLGRVRGGAPGERSVPSRVPFCSVRFETGHEGDTHGASPSHVSRGRGVCQITRLTGRDRQSLERGCGSEGRALESALFSAHRTSGGMPCRERCSGSRHSWPSGRRPAPTPSRTWGSWRADPQEPLPVHPRACHTRRAGKRVRGHSQWLARRSTRLLGNLPEAVE